MGALGAATGRLAASDDGWCSALVLGQEPLHLGNGPCLGGTAPLDGVGEPDQLATLASGIRKPAVGTAHRSHHFEKLVVESLPRLYDYCVDRKGVDTPTLPSGFPHTICSGWRPDHGIRGHNPCMGCPAEPVPSPRTLLSRARSAPR